MSNRGSRAPRNWPSEEHFDLARDLLADFELRLETGDSREVAMARAVRDQLEAAGACMHCHEELECPKCDDWDACECCSARMHCPACSGCSTGEEKA